MNAEKYLSVLNPEQLEAVQHSGSPLLILAGAGSGKTRVITTKIAWLISECGVFPSSILAVTFTKKAAKEMAERAEQLEPLAARAQIRTFHSFGSWFLRLHPEEAGIDPHFTVYDDDDMVTLVSKAVPTLTKQQAARFAHKISLAKDYCLQPDSSGLDRIEQDEAFASVYEAYQARLRETGNVDFGDLIMLPVLVLKNNPEVRQRIQSRFRVVMVDEYQDSNVAQFELLQQLAGDQTYVCVVGDDDQSIYKFRGAEVRNILTFQEHFPGTTVIRLERNYRSVSPVLSVADAVVSKNTGRLGKTLVAERGGGKKPKIVFLPNQDDETSFCSELIMREHKKGVPYADWAILYRTNAQSLGFETEFLHRKIPYTVVGSLKFYEREEIKDILSYLALIANRKDEIAFRRIVNKPARGIGAVTQDKIVELYRAGVAAQARSLIPDTPGYNLVDACRETVQKAAKKTKSGLQDFITLLDDLVAGIAAVSAPEPQAETGDLPEPGYQTETGDLPAPEPQTETADLPESEHQTETGDLPESEPQAETGDLSASEPQAETADLSDTGKLSVFVENIIRLSGLSSYYESQDEIAGTQRLANLQELVNSAVLYPFSMTGLLDFLDHIELDRTLELASEDEANRDAVTLITLHNTKGLEFPRVIITGLEYGIFPRRDKEADELEEERRLFYVGITRARDELYLTSCAMRRLYGKTDFQEISPFLLEIDQNEVEVLGTRPAAFKRAALCAGTGTGTAPGNPEFAELAARWKIGTNVYHDDYGCGVIIKTDDTDSEYVVSVQFETGAVKRFMPKYQANRLMICRE